jgi:hypothetical protein
VTHRAVAPSSCNLAAVLNDVGINRLNVDRATKGWPCNFRPTDLPRWTSRESALRQTGSESRYSLNLGPRPRPASPAWRKVDGASYGPSVFEIDHPLYTRKIKPRVALLLETAAP